MGFVDVGGVYEVCGCRRGIWGVDVGGVYGVWM